MGAIGRHVTQAKTSELTNWIYKVKVKKQNFKRKNLFIEVVLSNTLSHAEHLLRAKQQERKMKWERIKSTLPAGVKTSKMEVTAAATPCKDLSSIDDFMYQLSQIKVPVQR